VVPCMNPDGLENRPSARRMNGHGVDLNRNFPTPDWTQRAMPYWVSVTRKDPRRYPGQQAQSEPETRWLVQEIEKFQPDAIVQVHAPYGVLDYDGPHEPPPNLGFLDLHLLGTYPGSLGNYAGVHLGLPVITLELPQSGKLPSQTQTDRLWGDLLAWLDRNLPPSGKAVPTSTRVDGAGPAGGAAQ
jgi:protein MpaA